MKLFPIQEAGAPAKESRRGRGAYNSRLTVNESEPVSFVAPITVRSPEVDQISKPTDHGQEMPTASRCGQLPGCLPDGYTLDSLLTTEQFRIWLQVSVDWFKSRRKRIVGKIQFSQKMVRIHPRSFLEKRLIK